MNNKILLLLFFVLIIFVLSCKHERDGAQQDAALLEEAQSQAIFYLADSALLPGISPSPHGSFRLRYNQIFKDFLDDMENVPMDQSIPAGSLIVKDIYTNDQLTQIAIMKKEDGHPDAGLGWLWAEYFSDGRAFVSSVDKGAVCTGCHSTAPNSDLTKTFDLH